MSSRSSTSSFRRSLLLGALLCAAVYAALEASALPRTAYFGGRKLAQKFVRLEALERSGDVRVLVVGPSFVDQGFDAEIFTRATGETTFNLGVSGTDLYFQSVLLREVLLQRGQPGAVLWSLRDEALSRSNINRQYLAAPALAYARGPLGPRGFSLGAHLPQFHRRRLSDWLREWFTTEPEPVDAHGQTDLATLTRGERQAAREQEDDERPAFLAEEYAVDLATAEAHVAETLRRLRERGVKVWFLLTPYHESVFTRRSKYAELVLTDVNVAYTRWLTELAARFGVPVIDLHYCEEISTRPEYFFDSRHLNGPGAAALSGLLARLYLGERPIPEAWLGTPSRAQREALLGRVERGRIPLLALAERHPLESALCERRAGAGVLDLCAAFTLERPSAIQLVLHDRVPRAHSGSFFVRLGGEHHEVWTPASGAARAFTVASAQLPAGEHLLEIHTRTGEPIDWDELQLVASGAGR